jgi:bisphosphoglycerate-dependent phosphoglycerate mutase
MIFLLRHAERIDQSKDQKEKDIWNKSARCKTNLYDIPLSIGGISQAYNGIGKIIPKNYKGEFDYIYCSPLTRCIQTALQFQKYILDKFDKIVLVRIEYGLSIHMFKENEMFWMGSNIKLVGDKFVVSKIFEFIDKYLDKEKIYKRYGAKRFDIGYKSFFSREQINLEQTYTDALATRIEAIKHIAKIADKSKITLICAHCETCHLIYNYINRKWLSTKDAPKYPHIGGFKIGVKPNKLVFLEMIG